jgi:hypothetical protein
MMGGGPFILLKVGQSWRKTAKRAEIPIAGLPTILSILHSRGRKSSEVHAMVVVGGKFPWDMDNSSKIRLFCYLDHSLSPEITAGSRDSDSFKDK